MNREMADITVHFTRRPGTEDVPLPKYMSEHASGMDVCAAVEAPVTIAPGEVKLIPTGLTVAIPPGYEVQVRPRSGLALKHGLTVVNAPGTIDSDYRGEVGIILGNVGRQPFTVERGMRIAQLVVQRVIRAELVERDTLPATARSSGGFGHTGLLDGPVVAEPRVGYDAVGGGAKQGGAVAETIQEQFKWLCDHPEEEAKYAGEFIAVADGKIVAHGKNCGEVIDEATRLGYAQPLIGYAFGEETYVL